MILSSTKIQALKVFCLMLLFTILSSSSMHDNMHDSFHQQEEAVDCGAYAVGYADAMCEVIWVSCTMEDWWTMLDWGWDACIHQ